MYNMQQQKQRLSSPGNDVQYFEQFKFIAVFSALSDASYASKTHSHILHFPGNLLVRHVGPSTGNP